MKRKITLYGSENQLMFLYAEEMNKLGKKTKFFSCSIGWHTIHESLW